MRFIICLVFFLHLFTGCKGQVEKDNIEVIPVAVSEPALSIERFDKNFHVYLENPTPDNLKFLQEKYKDFLPAFGRVTINNSDSFKPEFYQRLQRYFSNDMLSKIYDDALNAFVDVTSYERELYKVNNYIADNFKGRQLPALYMHVSGFKENVMVLDGIISLSVDRYLGTEYPGYLQFFESYERIQMQPSMIVRDYVRAWLLSEEYLTDKKVNMLEEMIYEGKVLYSLSRLLPDKNMDILIGFSPDQISWCIENEKKIWQSIINQNHLYEQNYLVINKYMNPAPYTMTLTPDSPGRVGAWTGFRIVEAFMLKKNMTLPDLLAMNAQQLLKDSGYNP